MNISVYLEAPLIQQAGRYAQKTGMTRNAIIREALRLWLEEHEKINWPESVLQFRGDENWLSFEKEREDLLFVDKDPFE